MRTTHRSELELTQKIFTTATVTVSGLYFSTHSVVVTLIGTALPSLLAGWTLWLAHRRPRKIKYGTTGSHSCHDRNSETTSHIVATRAYPAKSIRGV